MKTLLMLSATLAFGALALGGASAACRPIGAVLAGEPQLSRFDQALRASHMLAVVDGPAVYTVFAPTNAALARIPRARWQALRRDRVALTRLMSYHLVKGRVTEREARAGLTPTTLAGVPLSLRPLGRHLAVNGAHARDAVLSACNGLIYVIDTLLLPENVTPALNAATVAVSRAPALPQTIDVKDIAPLPLGSAARQSAARQGGARASGALGSSVAKAVRADPRLRTLSRALDLAGLTRTLGSAGSYTLLAPTDAAFAKIPRAQLTALLADPQALGQVLAYHLLPRRIEESDLKRLQNARTVQGAAISATPGGTTVRIGNANVVGTAASTENGVVYLIDSVLLPPNFKLPANK